MPIEETANMMHMWAAVIQRSADQKDIMAMTKRYWNLFQTWANYLVQNLPDPGEQLCTDDFEGPSPHNANLAAKGILGIAAYAQICNFMGRSTDAQKYNSIAQDYAKQWATLALDSDRIHTKLEYDKNNTFSLKYNIYYQYVLNMTLLMDPQPDIKYYLSQKMNKYGVPLDNRATFTKLDWLYWMAAMGTDEQFAKFNEAGFNMAEATTRGIPLTDWYETTNAAIKGFRARPVVGGIYARMVLKK
jgi:alpha-D-ribose 1-methylphosphonate 5-triphosphate diphosphatase PhnM